ncbi:MAG: SLC13 family permease [Acidobacteriota bacterium]
MLTISAWIAIGVFLATYALIIIDKIHRTIIALCGGMLLLVLGIVSQEYAITKAIDFNTIGLLVGMMIIVNITARSGVFEYLAVISTKIARGRPILILVTISVITAVLSAFLNNVTVVLLIVPVTFAITERLNVSVWPFLFSEVFASNIGGTATLIGDPPNVMIGSQVGLSFMDFVNNVTLPNIVILAVTLAIIAFIFRKRLNTGEEQINAVMELNPKDQIQNYYILYISLFVLLSTIVSFVFYQQLHVELASIALAGAAVLMLLTMDNPEETLQTVEWTSIFFFIGLFVIVGSLEHTKVIESVAKVSMTITNGNLLGTGMLVLWLSAIASAFVDNIPFVATMIPLLKSLGTMAGFDAMQMQSLWWALALGACLGGNGTLIGASANIVVAGMAEKRGVSFSFMEYLKLGFPLMLVSIVISMIYLYLFYWR